ncbi:CDP-diacylglycerol--glycerol-3-phosphate 3-phosphatidyltransferase [Oxobacter pfennigii]|uniref:CDP-diacylglycerol--glycerol-3-phosphate 3-phosphatidyltransferase n=1 Tax=Oxobacter pfennigii TaxID=36849 RepID=A0A0P8W735_9CLOT|nr:CDP-diacylglycerol--glycerol-3-phosphate 3-phosphatidyltransferase [Oxobacter pfennigii]KPU43889.1 CDP-diacylglycerol--glycerol-3-phosphate 3-phosphatidyltransferase [Oxobacter pfennigii]
MNLANKLTILRIILIPVFLILLTLKVQYGVYLATAVFIIAALTDKLDGYIARTRNQITTLGKFMDPLADKLLVAAALISLLELQKLSTWVVLVIIAREFVITGLRAVAATEGVVIAASWWGKLKTTVQIIAIIAVLIDIPYYNVLVWIAAVITIISGVDYIYKNRMIFKFQ